MFAILNIELNYPAGEGYEKDHYRIKFKTDNGSYYFYSIEKLQKKLIRNKYFSDKFFYVNIM